MNISKELRSIKELKKPIKIYSKMVNIVLELEKLKEDKTFMALWNWKPDKNWRN